MLLLGAGLITTARIGAEQKRATAAEGEAVAALANADALLADSLVAQAVNAMRSDDRATAEILASSALVLQPSAQARGVLAASWMAQRPRRIAQAATNCASAVFARDASALLCVQPGNVTLYELGAPGELEATWSLAVDPVELAIVDQQVLLTTRTNRLEIYDRQDGEQVHTEDLPKAFRLEPALDEGIVLFAWRRGVSLFDLEQFEFHELPMPCGSKTQLVASALAPDASLVAVACRDGRVRLLRPQVASPAWSTAYESQEADHMLELVFAGHELVIWRAGVGMALYDAAEGERRVGIGGPKLFDVQDLMASSSHPWVLVRDSYRGIQLWNRATRRWGPRLPTDATAIVLDESGRALIAGAQLGWWALPTERWHTRFESPAGLGAVAISPDGRSLATAGAEGLVHVTDLATGVSRTLRSWQSQVVKSLDFSHDGESLHVTTIGEPGLRTIDLEDESAQLQPAAGVAYRRVVTLPGDVVLALSYSGPPEVLDPLHGRREIDITGRRTIFKDGFVVGGMADAPAFGVLVGIDGTIVRLVAGESQRFGEMCRLPGVRAAAISPDGQEFVVAFSRVVQVRAADNCALMRELDPPGNQAQDVAWSPDGAWIAIALLDGRIAVHRAAETERVAMLQGHELRVAALAFDPNSKFLASASWDGSVRTWDLSVLDRNAEMMKTQAEIEWGLAMEDVLREP